MPTTLDEYREAKQTYLKLRAQAKKELLARYHEVAGELVRLQRELLEDFGEKVALPARGAAGKAKKAVKKAAVEAAPAPEPAAVSPKIAALKKQVEAQNKKLEGARAAGKATKAIEDRIYELEDALRLAQA
jgi:hypothetical protein